MTARAAATSSVMEGPGGCDRPALRRDRPRDRTDGAAGYRCTGAHAVVYLLLAAALVGLHAVDGFLASAAATTAGCFALLLVGLPHGTLDLELIKRERGAGRTPLPVLMLYLGLAAAMYALWRVAPVAALVAFLLTAAVHFAEDWRETGEPFLAQGTAVALLSAPALVHRAELAALFTALSGDGRAAVLADVLLIVAPVGLVVAAVAAQALWTTGRRPQAAVTAATLAAMTLLPPVIGFALFFCVHHSPRHLGGAWDDLTRAGPGRYLPVAAGLTVAALGVAAALFALETRADFSARVVAASFMTLSILTVPHMAVPAILSRRKRG